MPTAEADFVAFVPLSNWLRGFDRYRMRYSKALLPESRFPDAFYMLRVGELAAPGLGKARRLVDRLGRRGDRVVALRARLPLGEGGMVPNVVTGTGVGWRWPHGEVPVVGVGWVDDVGDVVPTRIEDVTAAAFAVGDPTLHAWSACRPRSFSVLPVAQACAASCPFCFSKASVSALARQPSLPLASVAAWADAALARGAERAVITGGGEPTLVSEPALRALVTEVSRRFPSTLLITNGSGLAGGRLRRLVDAGLRTLAVSRHGTSPEADAAIMGINVDSGALAAEATALGLRARAICVLQRGGVDSGEKVRAYLERSANDGFSEVCFKELYVSSLAENPWAAGTVNGWAEAHQVPLARVIESLDAMGFRPAGALPWGSPLYAGEVLGRPLRVAAYTEPSVGWERSHAVVRSWNLLADGRCFASLEDPASDLLGNEPAA